MQTNLTEQDVAFIIGVTATVVAIICLIIHLLIVSGVEKSWKRTANNQWYRGIDLGEQKCKTVLLEPLLRFVENETGRTVRCVPTPDGRAMRWQLVGKKREIEAAFNKVEEAMRKLSGKDEDADTIRLKPCPLTFVRVNELLQRFRDRQLLAGVPESVINGVA